MNASDRFDVSALHMAADEGHVDCIALLLENDALCNNGTKYSKHGSYTGRPVLYVYNDMMIYMIYDIL